MFCKSGLLKHENRHLLKNHPSFISKFFYNNLPLPFKRKHGLQGRKLEGMPNWGGGGEGDILQLCSMVPKLMTRWAPMCATSWIRPCCLYAHMPCTTTYSHPAIPTFWCNLHLFLVKASSIKQLHSIAY